MADAVSPNLADIHEAAERLRAGRVVAFPTETVYGLGADALNEGAVARVFALKGRPSTNPLIVHVSGPEMARRVTAEWPEWAERLARWFWPGPLTLILPKAACVPSIVTGGGGTVAVRCPDHPVALALLFHYQRPLVGPSANKSGGISPTTAEHVRSAFAGEDVMVLEGGACRTGIESTVVDVSGADPAVLRPGAVGATEIAAVLRRPVRIDEGTHTGVGPSVSPGRMARHYAPRTPARMFGAEEWPGVLPRDGSAVVITHEERRADPPHRVIRLSSEAAGYAAGLYAALHEADALGATVVLIERPPAGDGIWSAVLDRLTRATTEED
jgi:L-threonylcarbamoyladenylate synthase